MRANVFVFLLAGLVEFGVLDAPGQTSSAPSQTAAPPPDPAKIAEYQARFQHGYDLEQAGKLEDARAIYDGILAEQPDAKRSLLEAGRISLELNEPDKADAYLEKLHALVPDFPEAYELLIQANQALKKDIKVERLVREYRALRDSGRANFDPEKPYFTREILPLDKGAEIVIYQFFDFTQAPFYALKAELYGPGHIFQRELLLKYDPDATQGLRARDPTHPNAMVFILAEPFFGGNKMTRIDVYQELLVTPEYMKARNLMLGDFAQPPKPMYSAPVDSSTSQ
jgi:tetratricopeptide (TPR) repeat protein